MHRIVYRSSLGAAVLAVVIGLLLFFGANPVAEQQDARAQTAPTRVNSPKVEAPADSTQVTVVSPSAESLLRVTTQPAQVEPYERTEVYAKASGFLAKVLVDIGDRVEKDQVLAELWIPEMGQELQQRAALVEQARAAVEQAEARLGSADALVAAAEAEQAEAEAAILQHEAECRFRTSEHRRIVELVASSTVNEAVRDEKLNQLQSAEAARTATHAQVESATANVKVAVARQRQARADVEFAHAALKVAEANYEQTQVLVDYALVRAPYDGLVTQRWIDSGDFVTSAATNGKSEPLFTVDRDDKFRIVFDVPESESAMVRIGQRTSLVVDALQGRSFAGHVARTAGVLDSKTRTLRVEAELDEPDASLRAGMYGMISATLAENQQATLLLPRR